jgi:hypothetical protein
MTTWGWFTDNRDINRAGLSLEEKRMRYKHHIKYTRTGNPTPEFYIQMLKGQIRAYVPSGAKNACDIYYGFDIANNKKVKQNKSSRCTSPKYSHLRDEILFMDKQYQEHLKKEKIKKQNLELIEKIKEEKIRIEEEIRLRDEEKRLLIEEENTDILKAVESTPNTESSIGIGELMGKRAKLEEPIKKGIGIGLLALGAGLLLFGLKKLK